MTQSNGAPAGSSVGGAATAAGADDVASVSAGGDFTPDQSAKMADWLKETTPKQHGESLKAQGVDAKPAETSDHVPGFEPAAAEQFKLPRLNEVARRQGVNDPSVKQLMTADAQARSWLATGEFPAAIGSHVAQEAARVDRLWSTMNPTSREIFQRKQMSILEQRYGGSLNEKLNLARGFISEIEKKSPGLVEYLEASGAGNSAIIVGQVVEHATRLAARAAAKVKR